MGFGRRRPMVCPHLPGDIRVGRRWFGILGVVTDCPVCRDNAASDWSSLSTLIVIPWPSLCTCSGPQPAGLFFPDTCCSSSVRQ